MPLFPASDAENGLYDCAALARVFWSRAGEKIGARFHRRNAVVYSPGAAQAADE